MFVLDCKSFSAAEKQAITHLEIIDCFKKILVHVVVSPVAPFTNMV